jgi:hypothetical protein
MAITVSDGGPVGRREQKLIDTGSEAPALVIEARETKQRLGISYARMWELKLGVRPAGESEFAARAEAYFEYANRPAPGAIIHVIYDPKHPKRLIVDQRSDEERAAGVGRPLRGSDAPTAKQLATGRAMTSAKQIVQTLNPLAQPVPARQAQDVLAQGRMAVSAASGLKSGAAPGEAPSVQILTFGPDGQLVTPATGAAPDSDPVDQLAKLADLRDRGVLTNEEFEAQKRRILGQ